MNLLFLMDPLESININKDTSFAIMLAAYKKGHNVYYLPKGGLCLTKDGMIFHVISLIPQENKKTPFKNQQSLQLQEKNIDGIFIRTDPPFDEDYLYHTWLLDRLPENIALMNNPTGIRTVNEKIWVTQFKKIIPPTIISRQKADLMDFIDQHNIVIAKPTNSYGGQSVFRIQKNDLNKHVILETISCKYQKDIILQVYINAAHEGDKRILLLNGDPLGAILRKHNDYDHRNNFFAGGAALPTRISKHDKKIISILNPYLRNLGLYFVGIDIIGDYLIEVNVTSPTCLQEMNKLYNEQLEEKLVKFMEALIKKVKPARVSDQFLMSENKNRKEKK